MAGSMGARRRCVTRFAHRRPRPLLDSSLHHKHKEECHG